MVYGVSRTHKHRSGPGLFFLGFATRKYFFRVKLENLNSKFFEIQKFRVKLEKNQVKKSKNFEFNSKFFNSQFLKSPTRKISSLTRKICLLGIARRRREIFYDRTFENTSKTMFSRVLRLQNAVRRELSLKEFVNLELKISPKKS